MDQKKNKRESNILRTVPVNAKFNKLSFVDVCLYSQYCNIVVFFETVKWVWFKLFPKFLELPITEMEEYGIK